MHQQRKDPLDGATVGERYVVHSRLARGGMSTVYLATDIRLDRHVALKVLYPHLAEEPGFIHRFEQEAKAAAKLSHPHVVGVMDQGVEQLDGQATAYLVMEYVPGRTLRDVLREHGRLTPRHALVLLDAVVEGLAAAHDAGLIHRDVKPENVLLSDSGQVKIADFGLARAVSASTGTASLVGTVAYLSPELVLGDPAEAQSDIYSVGIMLFELLTGRQPFTGESPIQVALQHARAEVPAPSSLLPGLAADLDELVQWCTSRDPEERPVNGTALLGELRHIRTTLTDEELDYASADSTAAETARHQDQLTVAVVPPIAPDVAPSTVVLPRWAENDNRTSVLDADRNATRAIGAVPVTPPQQPRPHGSTARPLSTRHQARQAQQPQKSLRGVAGRRSVRLLVILLIVLAVLVAAGSWLFGSGPAGVVSLPDVSDVPLAEARAVLAEEGLLSLSTDEVFDDTVTAGLVIGTDPAATAEVRRFEPVELLVSKGPELFEVPDLVGGSQLDAAAELGASQVTLGVVGEEYSETEPAGEVIRQSPAAGSQRRGGSAVDLVVSLGPAPITVPDVTGLDEQAAVAALQDSGLEAVVSDARENSRTVPAGSVLRQSPSGVEVQRGTAVTITVSDGPRIVRVPNVFSQPEERAVATLEAAGFAVQVDYTFGSSVLGLVAGQSPTGDQPEGTTIRITVT